MRRGWQRGLVSGAILLVAAVGVFGLLLRRTTGGGGQFELVFMRPVANVYFVAAVIVIAALAIGLVMWMRSRHV